MNWECSVDGCTNDSTKRLDGRAIPTKGDDGEPINMEIALAGENHVQMLLEEGEGNRIMTFACDEHEASLIEQREAWEDDPLRLPLGIWTREED